ncbi:hypothetical protein AYI69_g971 [Smittium culicis]|uniref:Uncharacterized protein n=1 Tax=Smittium culicis TaxID=133412 RepID=A0A1R1YRL4_9FUNG|nr:hypothetical protein AYI69_g971 [Smittium culicis]
MVYTIKDRVSVENSYFERGINKWRVLFTKKSTQNKYTVYYCVNFKINGCKGDLKVVNKENGVVETFITNNHSEDCYVEKKKSEKEEI